MNWLHKTTMAVAVLVAALAVAPAAWAQDATGGGKHKGRATRAGKVGGAHKAKGNQAGLRCTPLGGLLAKLDLTEDQKTQIHQAAVKVRQDHRAEVQKALADHPDLAKQLKDARAAKDKAKVQAARAELVKVMAEGQPVRVKFREQIRPILTAAQNTQFDDLLAAKAKHAEARKTPGLHRANKIHKARKVAPSA